MKRRLLFLVPVGHFLIFVVYYLLSGDWAGTAMSWGFALAMAVFLWILVPTSSNVGPTAPVDPDFEAPGR